MCTVSSFPEVCISPFFLTHLLLKAKITLLNLVASEPPLTDKE